MKAIEVTGRVDERGNLSLDRPIETTTPSAVRVIVLFDEEENDPDDTSVEEIKASLIRALQEARSRRRIPGSKMWEAIDD